MKKTILLHNCAALGAFELRLIDGVWCIYHTLKKAVELIAQSADYSAAFEICKAAINRARLLHNARAKGEKN